jgi:hypothetical protein
MPESWHDGGLGNNTALILLFPFLFQLHFSPNKIQQSANSPPQRQHPQLKTQSAGGECEWESKRDKYPSCHHKIFKAQSPGGSSWQRRRRDQFIRRTHPRRHPGCVPTRLLVIDKVASAAFLAPILLCTRAHLSAYKLAALHGHEGPEKTLCVRRAM